MADARGVHTISAIIRPLCRANNEEKPALSTMDVLDLALLYFRLTFIGFACGKLRKLPEPGLDWMNFFLLYVSLPALFFRIVSRNAIRGTQQSALRDRNHAGDCPSWSGG